MKWYYAIESQIKGPVSRTELETLFNAGNLPAGTLVTQEGMYDWFPFVNLKKTTQILPLMGPEPTKAAA